LKGEQQMKNKNILISGASIAGPALAYWLRRYGFNPTIVEQAPAPRPGGQAIDLRGTAREVVERMGLMEDVRQAHTGTHGMASVNRDGKQLMTMTPDLFGDSGGAIAELEILRGDLVRTLYQATCDEVEYIFDDSIVELTQKEDGVEVVLERSAPRKFDLVVGADGMHSNVRQHAFGPESQFIRDLGGYIAVYTMYTHLNLAGWQLIYGIPGKNRGKTAGLYPIRNASEAKAMFYFASPPLIFDRHDIQAQKQLLAHAFSVEGWEVPHMLEAMWEAPDFYFDRVGQVHMNRWSNGRVVLLGDAGYSGSPMGGNGTSMALIGAYVLAGELAVSNGDYHSAFAQYEHEMRDFVKRCQEFALQGKAFLMPDSRIQYWLINQITRLLPYLPSKKLITEDFQKTTNSITLKDYRC
jgi:2-polyprenyl-6-methoxyphenol hydroxylase-like FAD-dependent oxidoreductase